MWRFSFFFQFIIILLCFMMRLLGRACLLRSIAVLHTLSIQSLVLKVIRFAAYLWKKKKNRFPWNFLQVEKFSCIPGRIRSATLFWFNSDQMTKCSSLQKRQTDHSLLHALGYQRPLRKGSRYLHIRSWAFGHALAKIPQFLWSMAPQLIFNSLSVLFTYLFISI